MDVAIYHAVNGIAGHAVWLDRLLRWLATYLPVALVATLGAVWFWPGSLAEREERERLVIYAVTAALLGLLLSQGLGHLWFRDRPYLHHRAHLLVHPSPDPSFPSDHAVGGFALVFPFLLARHRPRWLLLSLATLLSVARVAVGTHYPSDVLGGALLGPAAAYLVWYTRRWTDRPLAATLRLGHRFHLA